MRFTQDQVRDARSRAFEDGQNAERRKHSWVAMKWLAAGLGWGCVIGFSVACTLVITRIITLPS